MFMPSSKHFFEIEYRTSAESYFLSLKPLGQRIWLDSGRPFSQSGRFDIISASPDQILIDPACEEIDDKRKSLAAQWQTMGEKLTQDIPFWGGVIGYFNYEYNATTFAIDVERPGIRPSIFGVFSWALIQDHSTKKSFLVFLPGCVKYSVVQKALDAEATMTGNEFFVKDLSPDLPKEHYFQALDKIQRYIIEGDTYQINFAQRFSGEFNGNQDLAYLSLRRHMPSPFSAYLELEKDVVMSFSPERFIQIDHGHATTEPIKGTAPRSSDPHIDKALADSLHKSGKNRAENLMIVDLLRNDFSKSCKPYSVRVPALFMLKTFTNVHHLVSIVEGKIIEGVTPLEFLRRCFPGGSITGAPKKRAMEIIRELEEYPRNIYCGSICYWDAGGKFDSNISIRTLLISEGVIYCWGGGGIVADSDPEEEYQESLHKIAVLIKALKGSMPK